MDLCTVHTQGDTLGGGVGDHIGQGGKPYTGPGGESAAGQQRADLTNCGGHGGALDFVEQGQGLVRQAKPQPGQGTQHPIPQRQDVWTPGAWAAGALPLLTPPVEPSFPGGGERPG